MKVKTLGQRPISLWLKLSKVKTKIKSTYIKYLLFVLLFAILLIGGFLRLYKIREYMTFLGDEGRDVLVVKRMIVDHKFTLLGPITSVGSMYMGPIYYYFMAPFLLLWHFDPVGPAVMVALFALLTILLVYILGAEFFSTGVGLTASFLYAISPLTITYGRSSWNPNIVPFFSLLIIYSLMKVIVKRQYRWFTVAGFSLGILIQLHYVTLMFFPIIIFSLILYRPKLVWRNYLLGIAAFLISYSPFLLFELRHQFVNTTAVWRFFMTQKGGSPVNIMTIWDTIADVFVRLFWRLEVIVNAEVTKLFILSLAVTLYIYWRSLDKKAPENLALKILTVWLLVGMLSYGLYGGVIYDYYFGGLFALPFILTGIMLAFLWQKREIGKITALVILIALVIFNLEKSHLRMAPSNLLRNTETIAREVFEATNGQPYNFALIALKNSDHAYRYFLELWGPPPVTIENPDNDPQRRTVTGQLLVVCEETVCQPLGHPLWEIAGFGQGEITDEWKVVTARIFRLVGLNKI